MPQRFLLLFGLSLAALLLAACGRPTAQTWPGVSADSQYVYIAQGQQVHAVNLADGKQIWSFPTAVNNNISQIVSQPGVSSDVVVVGSEGATNTYNGIAYGLDRNTGTQKWCLAFDQKGAEAQGCPLAQGGVPNGLFGISPAVDDRIQGGVALTDGVAYFGLASGRLYAVDAETGKDLWYFQTNRDIWATPLVTSDSIYVASLDHFVYALDRTTHALRWKRDMGASVAGAPTLDSGKLFVGTFANAMVALDAASGAPQWTFATQNWVWSGPEVAQGVLYFTDVTGNVYAADEATGQQKWMVKPGGEMRAHPVLANGNLYVGDHDGNFFALDPATGSTRWHQTMKGQLLVPAIVVSDTVVVAPYSGDNLLMAYASDSTFKWPYNPSK